MSRLLIDTPTGFTGFTIDVFRGSESDTEGDVTKVLFSITFQERVNDVNFQITNNKNYWSALTPTGEYIGLTNPEVVQINRDSAIVAFDMESKYPSNSLMTLCARDTNADYSITDASTSRQFQPNTITGAMGFTSNEYGGGTNEEGEVERIVFNISFTRRESEIEFKITDNDDDWACLMGDGSYYQLKNPDVLFQNRDGATVVFTLYNPAQNSLSPEQRWCGYPSNSPGILVRRREQAKWTVTDIYDEAQFISVTNVVMPNYVPVGEHINLNTQAIVYPPNSTLRAINWELDEGNDAGTTISNGYVDTSNVGKLKLRATIPSGLGDGKNYSKKIELNIVSNWITITEHPHLESALITGEITEAATIAVVATTEFGDITYQWYRSGNGSNTSGQAISGATSPIFNIPKTLSAGDYYYFCEIRKPNFPSVRSNVAYVRVRDRLRSLSIYPSGISVPPGYTEQLGIDRNPNTADERAEILWTSSNDEIVSVDQNGLCTGHNDGECTIYATCGNIQTSIKAKGVFTPVTSINFNMDKTVEVGSVKLPTGVFPADATARQVVWSVVNAGTTGATVSNGILTTKAVGEVKLKAVVPKGLTPSTDFTQEWTLSVDHLFVPVTGITLNNNTTLRSGEVCYLSGNVFPENASAKAIRWELINTGDTGATLIGGNVLSVVNPGTVQVKAVVGNGKSRTEDYVQNFNIVFTEAFIPVIGIEGLPATVDYFYGDNTMGVQLNARVIPDNADNKTIVYSISPNDKSGLEPRITNGKLFFKSATMTENSQISITVRMTVKNGLSTGVDYVIDGAIYITPPAPKEYFIPIQGANWNLPSILRAYRPILADMTALYPYNASRKNKTWDVKRGGTNPDLDGCSALTFLPTEGNHQDLLDNGVLIDTQTEFDWARQMNYIYPMDAGKLNVILSVMDGMEPGVNFTENKLLDILDPFIAVKSIKNMPSEVYVGTYYLSPEIDTAGGMNEETALWDDRIATYNKIKYEIVEGDGATVNENGDLVTTKPGIIKVKLTIDNGVQEAYTWHTDTDDDDQKPIRDFERIDYEETFEITVRNLEGNNLLNFFKKPVVTLKLTNNKEVKIYNTTDFDKLRAVRPVDSELTINKTTFRRNEVKEITFGSNFAYTDLTNFGYNFTSLTKISGIPSTATKLKNFLYGCTSFNQMLTIPKNVNGESCLEGFLRGCSSFNQMISIPAVNGKSCLESFLRDCTSFNKPIRLPDTIQGDYAMYSFLQGCTSFNSSITLPTEIHGLRCMENVLRECHSFNKNITMPQKISGKYNIAAFMFECYNFNKAVIIPGSDVKETIKLEDDFYNDVITFSTFHKGTSQADCTHLFGPGAANFATKVGPQGRIDPANPNDYRTPFRTFTVDLGAPSTEEETYVSLYMDANVDAPEEYIASGDSFTYKFTVMNNSTVAINNVQITGSLPEGVTKTQVTCDKDGASVNDDSDISITVESMNAGESFEISVTVKADQLEDAAKEVDLTMNATYDEIGQSSDSISSVTAAATISLPSGLSIETQPTLSYEEGEDLDLEAMKIIATYGGEDEEEDDPRTVELNYNSDGVVCDPEHGTSLTVEDHNDTPIVVTYQGQTANTDNLVVTENAGD